MTGSKYNVMRGLVLVLMVSLTIGCATSRTPKTDDRPVMDFYGCGPFANGWRAWQPDQMLAQLGAGAGTVAADAALTSLLALLAVEGKNEGAAWLALGLGGSAPVFGSVVSGMMGDYYSGRKVGGLSGFLIGIVGGVGLGLATGPALLDEKSSIPEVGLWWGSVSLATTIISVPVYHWVAPFFCPDPDVYVD